MRLIAIGIAVVVGFGLFIAAGGGVMAPITVATVLLLVVFGGSKAIKWFRKRHA